jgi:hypothetical protein
MLKAASWSPCHGLGQVRFYPGTRRLGAIDAENNGVLGKVDQIGLVVFGRRG